MFNILLLLIMFGYVVSSQICREKCCIAKSSTDCIQINSSQEFRYIMYDVNAPEGFNLRRDVYIRMSVFAHNLNNSRNTKLKHFKLVLPPWVNIYHWEHEEQQTHRPWAHFFDLESLQKFAPVIEMHQFFYEVGLILGDHKKVNIDEVYVLQHFEEMFKSGKFEDKMSKSKCEEETRVGFFNYKNLTSDNVQCLSFHGHVSTLADVLARSSCRTVLFDHAEIALHDEYGGAAYWRARRSMRFSRTLLGLAERYRRDMLDSTDAADNTALPSDWRQERARRDARGGPYLGVHLRRRDFLWARGSSERAPSLEEVAAQIGAALRSLGLRRVYLATDAPLHELDRLGRLLLAEDERALVHVWTEQGPTRLTDGQVAAIDQIVCSHARHFIGTHESTFSYRIQEEREILGFPVHTTFNAFCPARHSNCRQPSVWTIVY